LARGGLLKFQVGDTAKVVSGEPQQEDLVGSIGIIRRVHHYSFEDEPGYWIEFPCSGGGSLSTGFSEHNLILVSKGNFRWQEERF
jgi:hypothetical protein